MRQQEEKINSQTSLFILLCYCFRFSNHQQESILSVVAADGSRVFAAAYDEWGQQRVTLREVVVTAKKRNPPMQKLMLTNDTPSPPLTLTGDALGVFGLGNTALNSLGESLKYNAGNSTYGNGKFYFHNKTERGFYGNQHVQTTRLTVVGAKIIKATGNIGKAISGIQIGIGIYKDIQTYQSQGYTNYYKTVRATGEWAGSFLGSQIGLNVGSLIGTELGSLFGPGGTIVGTIICGAACGFCGAYYGGQTAGLAVDYLYGK